MLRTRHQFFILAAYTAAACDGTEPSAPVRLPPPVPVPIPAPVPAPGTYTLNTAAGSALPARVHRVVDPETGAVTDVYVVSDTLELTVDGWYVQRARLEERDGTVVLRRSRWADHGRYTRSANGLRFVSDYLAWVAFYGSADSDSSVRLVQDLPGEGTSVAYMFHREH